MMHITIYAADSGVILRGLSANLSGSDIATFLAINLEPGEAWAEGEFDRDAFRFRDGVATALPVSPGPWAVFDPVGWVWTDPRDAGWFASELSEARRSALAQINRASGEIRARYITVIPGQEMLYILKEDEARAYLAASDPAIADYPLISAEIGITGHTAYEVAQVYVNKAAQLRVIAAVLETARLGAIAVIEVADAVPAIEAARDGFFAAAGAMP